MIQIKYIFNTHVTTNINHWNIQKKNKSCCKKNPGMSLIQKHCFYKFQNFIVIYNGYFSYINVFCVLLVVNKKNFKVKNLLELKILK